MSTQMVVSASPATGYIRRYANELDNADAQIAQAIESRAALLDRIKDELSWMDVPMRSASILARDKSLFVVGARVHLWLSSHESGRLRDSLSVHLADQCEGARPRSTWCNPKREGEPRTLRRRVGDRDFTTFLGVWSVLGLVEGSALIVPEAAGE